MAAPDIPPGFDLTDPDIYTARVPAAELAELRRAAPVWWVAQRRGSAGFDDEGYWAVTRHADILAISKTPDVYSSWENTALIRFTEGMPRESIELQRYILLNIDPPEHTKLRGIVSRGFTPRAVGSLRQALTERAQHIVATALETGTGEFVTDVASELPLQAISELLGVPQEDRGKIFSWSNRMIGYDERVADDDDGMVAATEILGYSLAMAEERRACPRDDIVTKLVSAEIDGQQLSDDEFGFFVLMLAVAGNETTRNAIAHGMLAFLDHPGQWELFKASRPVTAADEIVRWATPITVFQRTAVADTVLGGQEIKAGQRVGLFYRSANFDEEVFDHPERFDILRDPNPHLGFGGLGTHYCLGANLAKLEIELIFNAIADAMPDIRKAGTRCACAPAGSTASSSSRSPTADFPRPHGARAGGGPGGSAHGGPAAAGLTGLGGQGPAAGAGLLRPGHQHLRFQEQPLDALQGYGAAAFQRHGEQVQDPADPAACRRTRTGQPGGAARVTAASARAPPQSMNRSPDRSMISRSAGGRRAAAACWVRAGVVAMSSSPLTPRTQTRPSRVLVTVSGGKVTLACTPPCVPTPRTGQRS